MVDNILYARSRRVARVHNGKDVTHFFVDEDGWEEYYNSLMKTEAPYNMVNESEDPWTLKGSTAYGDVLIIYRQMEVHTYD